VHYQNSGGLPENCGISIGCKGELNVIHSWRLEIFSDREDPFLTPERDGNSSFPTEKNDTSNSTDEK
jgi:hypothetical protein